MSSTSFISGLLVLAHTYLVLFVNSYWTYVRVGFMPIDSEDLNRGAMFLNGLYFSSTTPVLSTFVDGTYMWYGSSLNGLIGAYAFLFYGMIALFWLSKRKAMRVVAGVALATCVCISLVFVASTPVLQWYELIIKLSLLAALTGLGIASEKLRQKLVDRLAGDEKEWSPS